MVFLPIVERELRVAARQRGTYWMRLGAALAALAVGGWIMLMPFYRSPSQLGMALFAALSTVTYIYSLLVGLRTTADCLSEEKREGTLGLLFLTDLKGYDIVLGKVVATSVNAFYGMLAIFPVMAIPLLAGGVTGAEFGRVVLASLNNLFFSLAVGMFCSAISRDERKAMALTFLVIAVFTAGLPFVGALVAERNRVMPHPIFFIPSPGYSAFMAFDEAQRSLRQFNFYYPSVLCVHGLSWALLALACYIVPRTWQDKAENPAAVRRRELWRRWAYGAPGVRARVRTRMLDINPFYWLAGRDRFKNALVWFLLGGLGLVWLWGLWRYPFVMKDSGVYVWTALLVHAFLKFWITTEACRRFVADRKSGALELLLATPVKIREIVGGQLLALWKQFAGPTAVVVLADFVFLLTERGETAWVLVWVAGIGMLIADMITLSWVSMWMGLCSRNTNRATAAALVRILVLPWMVVGLVATFVSLQAFTGSRAPDWMDEKAVPLFILMVKLVNDFIFGSWARFRLLETFREAATQRFSRPPQTEGAAPKSEPSRPIEVVLRS